MAQVRAYLECRSTGRGAYTSAGGQRFAQSGTGNHWREEVAGPVGREFVVTDISNSGKHECYRARLTSEPPHYEITEKADPYLPCPFCPPSPERIGRW